MSSSSSSSYSGTYDGSSSSSFYSDILHGYEDFPLDDNFIEDEIIMALMKEDMLNFKKRRTSKQRTVDYWSTSWGELITNPATKDLTTTEGKLFRRRFRVPFPVFEQVLVPLCREKNVFETKSAHRIPIEMKVLLCLRILGRNSCADDASELSGVAESSCLAFFKIFVKNFAKYIYPMYVKVPEGDNLARVMEVYRKLGFPGGLGSMDCTRLKWGMCPVQIRQSATGKEGFPTLVFQVIVDHSRFIHYCSNYFLGGMNDINTVLNDPYPRSVISGCLKEISFQLYDQNGELFNCRGAYLITDGGYPEFAVFIDPDHKRMSRNVVLWSEWLESVRKDIECTFGILKQRFRFLRDSVVYHNPETIQDAMKTCCCLHNMIMLFDGIDISGWESVVWEHLEPDADEDDIRAQAVSEEAVSEEEHDVHATSSVAVTQLSSVVKCFDVRIHKPLLKEALQQHFAVAFRKGDVRWPKNMTTDQITLITPLERAHNDLYASLYSKPSLLRVQGAEIGMGLFSGLRYDKNDDIVTFKGEFITFAIYKARESAGLGGYMIQFTADLYLDCYDQWKSHNCMASYANSPKNAYNTVTRCMAKPNCRLVINQQHRTARLVCGWDKEKTPKSFSIEPDTELLWDYADSYIFPT
jgi:Plant transposon protein